MAVARPAVGLIHSPAQDARHVLTGNIGRQLTNADVRPIRQRVQVRVHRRHEEIERVGGRSDEVEGCNHCGRHALGLRTGLDEADNKAATGNATAESRSKA